jgi:hypothetical protein
LRLADGEADAAPVAEDEELLFGFLGGGPAGGGVVVAEEPEPVAVDRVAGDDEHGSTLDAGCLAGGDDGDEAAVVVVRAGRTARGRV